jgi:hypothetical protein
MPDGWMNVQVAHDRKTATISLSLDERTPRKVEVSLGELDRLISELGDARSRMAEGLRRNDFEVADVAISAVANTTWWIKASPAAGALLAFDHPKFGPVGFTLSRDQIARIVAFLTNRFILQPPPSAEKH